MIDDSIRFHLRAKTTAAAAKVVFVFV